MKLRARIMVWLLNHNFRRILQLTDWVNRKLFHRSFGVKCRKCGKLIIWQDYLKRARWLNAMHDDCFMSQPVEDWLK